MPLILRLALILCLALPAGVALSQEDGWRLTPQAPPDLSDTAVAEPEVQDRPTPGPLTDPEAQRTGPDPLPPDPDATAAVEPGGVIAPRSDEPPAISYAPEAADGYTLSDPARPGGRTLPPEAEGRSAAGATQAVSPHAPMIYPAPTEPPSTEDQPAGVNAACTALTDPARRDACRMGSVAGQPALPPGDR